MDPVFYFAMKFFYFYLNKIIRRFQIALNAIECRISYHTVFIANLTTIKSLLVVRYLQFRSFDFIVSIAHKKTSFHHYLFEQETKYLKNKKLYRKKKC